MKVIKMTIKQLMEYGKKYLRKYEIQDAGIIVRVLLSNILGLNREQLIIKQEKEVTDEEQIKYVQELKNIADGKPLQYIINKQEFMKLNYYVDENVLIPQPDTEILVEEVIKIAKENRNNILDMCTGSGAIAISLAYYLENVEIVATDISEKALEIAQKNYNNNKRHNKIEFIKSDMFENVNKKFDIIVSNPPYIATGEMYKLDKQVQKEPILALDGGKDGLKFYKIFAIEAYRYLTKNGYLCLEIGYNQKEQVMNLLQETGMYSQIYSKKDLQGNDRIIIAHYSNV